MATHPVSDATRDSVSGLKRLKKVGILALTVAFVIQGQSFFHLSARGGVALAATFIALVVLLAEDLLHQRRHAG
jgi:hypothetical protein